MLEYMESAAAMVGTPPAARRHRDPRVHHLSGHHRGARRPHPRSRVRPARRLRLPPRLQPRAHRPRQRHLHVREHPQGRVGSRRRVARTGAVVLRPAGRQDRRRPRDRGGRADQAAREHLPPRQHRAGQRAGHLRPRPRHRRVGRHRGGRHQAVRLHEVHARARGRRPLPAHRPQLPVVAGAPEPGPVVPLRRAGQRRQRPHARLRRSSASPAA